MTTVHEPPTTAFDARSGALVADLATGADTDHVVVSEGTACVVDKAAAGPEQLDFVHRIRLCR